MKFNLDFCMMEQAINKKKEKLVSNLNLCLQKLYKLYGGDSFSYTVMPILYILVAHRHGMRFDVDSQDFNKDHFLQMPLEYDFDEQSQKLLYGISRFFPNLIRREISYCVADFYKVNNHLFNSFYKDLIDHILSLVVERGGRYSSEYTTPSYLVELLHKIIFLDKPKSIYDPCSGLCSIVTLPEMEQIYFEGQEINELSHLLASIRLDAYNRPLTVKCEDALSNWNYDIQSDLLLSDLPLGMKVTVPNRFGSRQSFLEDVIISNFIDTPALKKAVLVVAISSCYRSTNFSLRKDLCDKNYVDMVLELPNGVLAHTGLKPVILLLNKEKKDDKIKFVSASDCLTNAAHAKKSLDIETIMKRIIGSDKTQTTVCNVSELYRNDCNLSPYRYLRDEIEVLPGQKILPLKKIASQIRGSRSYNETEGYVIEPSCFCQSLADFHLKEQELPIKDVSSNTNYVKIDVPCVVFNRMMSRFFINYNESPVFIKSGTFFAFNVDNTKCSLEYFSMLMLNSKTLSSLKGDSAVPHITSGDLQELQIPIFEDKDSQRNLVERAYREVERELKAKIAKLQVLSGKSSDLLHNLGVTFTRMGAAVACLEGLLDEKDDVENALDMPRNLYFSNEGADRNEYEILSSSIDTLDANIKYALRQINSTGTDFDSVTPDLEIVDIEDVIERYLESWDSFGYGSFELLPLESSLSTTNPTMVKVDTSLLYTVLDCILANAHQHGFNRKANDRNQVSVELKPVTINRQLIDSICADEERYVLISVSNNGNPLPEGFTLKDFISRGIVGINSSQDGLGGDHICKITHMFGGKVSIETSDQWLSFNVMIPIYITPKDTNFNEYECESI